jgi:hypothetical protein
MHLQTIIFITYNFYHFFILNNMNEESLVEKLKNQHSKEKKQ